ncbi:MAG: hypothetical protein M3Z25_18050 [Actinomycetota bacterium]|nr:hypothetical protein [Actinomycetota bacterium]
MIEPAAWRDRVRRVAPEWASTFDAVPRDRFVPDKVWRKNPAGRGLVSLDRHTDPATWAQLVATDAAVITQVDDGAPQLPGGIGRAVTNSPALSWLMENRSVCVT